jgi:hypothetical protein
MKFHATLLAVTTVISAAAAEVPKIFNGLIEPNVPVKAQIGVVMPPPEIEKFIAKVENSARKDPKWFKDFSSTAKPGEPLPYDTHLGLTKEEYDEYLKLWAKRDFKSIEDVILLLRPSSGDTWTLSASGNATTLSTLRYVAKNDVFRSPNGEMKRIADIVADSSSILGQWTGFEWKLEEDTGLGKMKENFALGRYSDKRFGLIIYRAQELSSEGTRLLDKSMVIRFPLGKSAAPAATPKPPAKPAVTR